jgi:hypothetical protein
MIKPTKFTQHEGLAIDEIIVHGIRTIVGKRTSKEFINEENKELYFLVCIRGRGKSPAGRRAFISTNPNHTNGLYIVDSEVNHYYFGSTSAGYYRFSVDEFVENPWIIQPIHSQMPALGRRNRKLIKKMIKKYLKTIGEQTCQTAAT